jgi:hypothetical protein
METQIFEALLRVLRQEITYDQAVQQITNYFEAINPELSRTSWGTSARALIARYMDRSGEYGTPTSALGPSLNQTQLDQVTTATGNLSTTSDLLQGTGTREAQAIALEREKQTQEQRGQIFSDYMASLPTRGEGAVHPYFRQAIAARRVPIESQFMVEAMGAQPQTTAEGGTTWPTASTDFRQYLRTNPSLRINPTQFRADITELGRQAGYGQSYGVPWGEGTGPPLPSGTTDAQSQALAAMLGKYAPVFIPELAAAEMNPFLRPMQRQAVERNIAAWQGANPLGDLFQQWQQAGYDVPAAGFI